MKCRHCDADIEYRQGPQWTGWIAPALDGALRDCCFTDTEGAWVGHAPPGSAGMTLIARDHNGNTLGQIHLDVDPARIVDDVIRTDEADLIRFEAYMEVGKDTLTVTLNIGEEL